MVVFGSLFPIASQIACIKLSIQGNWNELYQADLQDADLTITINSKMFADFRQTIYNEYLLKYRLSEVEQIEDLEINKKRPKSVKYLETTNTTQKNHFLSNLDSEVLGA